MILPSALRFLASLALLVLVVLTMQEPLRLALGQRWIPILGILRASGSDAAPGFVVQVTSKPSGAGIDVDGTNLGKTPFLGNVACRGGQEVELRIHLDGFAPETRKVICREDGRLQARIQLHPTGR